MTGPAPEPVVLGAPPLVMPEARPAVRTRVLVVDDEPDILRMLRRVLMDLGYEVQVTDRPYDALELYRASAPAFDLVVTDYSMPGMDGLELVRAMRAERVDAFFLMITAQAPALSPAEFRQAGIHCVLTKPFSVRTFGALVQAALG